LGSPNQLPSFLLAAGDRGEVAHRIWLGYGLDKPNNYDTSAAFCQALLRDWEHNRPAYVWRTYGSARLEGRHVYVLPARFVIAHPPFLRTSQTDTTGSTRRWMSMMLRLRFIPASSSVSSGTGGGCVPSSVAGMNKHGIPNFQN